MFTRESVDSEMWMFFTVSCGVHKTTGYLGIGHDDSYFVPLKLTLIIKT